jgi:hypothetical protein
MASAYAMEADANLNAIPLTNGGQHRQAAARNFSTPASPRHFKKSSSCAKTANAMAHATTMATVLTVMIQNSTPRASASAKFFEVPPSPTHPIASARAP